jgi:hypothetical protein
MECALQDEGVGSPVKLLVNHPVCKGLTMITTLS